MWLIVGLGNPGLKYALTRHNVGFMALDYLVKAVGARNEDAKTEHDAITITFKWDSEQVKLVKPQTFMNLSGEPVREIVNFYKVPLENVVVLHDELDLPFGALRINTNSSAGGHNGVSSLIDQLGTQEFMRIRIGIGRSPIAGMDSADWVLQKFSEPETAKLPDVLNTAIDAVETLVFEGATKAMNLFNKKA